MKASERENDSEIQGTWSGANWVEECREAALRPLTASRAQRDCKVDKGQKTEGVSRMHAAEVREQQHPALRFEAADNLRRAERKRREAAESEHRAESLR